MIDPIGLMSGAEAAIWGAVGTGMLVLPIPGARIAGGIILGIVFLSIPSDTPADRCEDDGNNDFCYRRWKKEDGTCWQWKNLGTRVVKACQARAAHRRNLCIANGGKPNPSEPPEYNPFVDYPR